MNAEQSAVGAMMVSRDALHDVTDVLDAGDLFDMRLGHVFGAAVALDAAGAPVEPVAVVGWLNDHGLLDNVGGHAAIADLYTSAPPAGSAGYYARQVKREAVKRRLRAAATAIAQAVEEAGDADPADLVEGAHALLEETHPEVSGVLATLGADMDATIEALELPPSFLPTPWRTLNNFLDGLRPGALYVLGARPGSGKSIMGLNLAVHLSRWGDVAYSSLEMTRDELRTRLLAQRSGVHLSSLARRSLSGDDWERIAEVANDLRDLRIMTDDRSGVTMAQIRAHARAVKRRGTLVAVVVDYLQIVMGDRRRPRWEQVGEISRDLKIMARDLDVPVIALAQLNRESESNRRAPSMSDLRESGAIEQDADVVVLMQRGWDDINQEHTSNLDLWVAKNRHGITGKATLLWEGQYARVVDLPWGK